jgi:hypothetical protein
VVDTTVPAEAAMPAEEPAADATIPAEEPAADATVPAEEPAVEEPMDSTAIPADSATAQ